MKQFSPLLARDETAAPVARWLIPTLLVALMLATFWPLLTAEFTIWDDYRAIVTNPWLNPPSLAGFAQFWNPRHAFMDIWIPLTYTVWSAVAAISYVPTADVETGAHLNPWIFHGANLAVHGISVLLVYAIIKRIIGRPWPAAAGAALFAIHPVQVEAVGWLAGMKDLLAGCMGLVAVWQYLQYAQAYKEPRPSPRSPGSFAHYALAITAFVLAMLAKPSAVVVPFVLGALDLWLVRRPLSKVATSLTPWLLLAVPIVLVGHRAQPAPGVDVPWEMRPLIASDAIAFYLYKLFFPNWLGIVYDRAPGVVLAHRSYVLTWPAPLIALVAAILSRKRFPWLTASLAVFCLALVPVLGLIPFEFQSLSTVADHYLYLAMCGPALAIAFIAARIKSRPAIALLTAMIVALAARSSVQAFTWRDSISLFSNAVRVNPHSCAAYNNLAEALRSQRQYTRSAETFESGLRFNPDCVPLRIGYASLLAAIDQPADARKQFEIAAQTATGDYARLVRESLAKLSAPTTNSASRPHLTPGDSPIE